MKLRMAENSLFAILLRNPWWLSLAIAGVMALLALALLPAEWRVVGATSGLPFAVIAVMAAWRQRRLPSAARVEQVHAAASAMAWPAFADLLEQAFRRDGYAVQRRTEGAVDFVLEREGRRTLVAARRWKSARMGLDVLRALQAAREASDDAITEAVVVGLGELSDTARSFASQQRIAVWQAAELAQALRGIEVGAKPAARG